MGESYSVSGHSNASLFSRFLLKLIASNEASPSVLARIQIRIREYGLTGLVFIEETLPDRGAAL
jgi:hypothetical protein